MPVSKGGGSGPLCIVSHPLELCSERRNLRIRPNKSDSDFISNRNSEWSTRTFNLDLKFGADDDLGELLDQLILKKHQNAPGRQGRGHPGSLFDEYELESALPSNSDYLKCDLACLGFRLQETGFKAHAEFLIYMKFGDVIVSSWKRFNDFKNLANTIDLRDFPYILTAYRRILSSLKLFRCLEEQYLMSKCSRLENFLRCILFAINNPSPLLSFML